jgi:anti-anti-sigma regulatory factor
MDTLQIVEQRPGVIALHGALTGTLSAVREHLLASLAAGSDLELDLSGVSVIDLCGAELLLRLQHEALMVRKGLTLVGFTAEVNETLDGLQLGRTLCTGSARNWS